jgi:UDP-N-acetylmuramate--alanine ligase
MKYLLSGVGGIGLSALAWCLKVEGHEVYGSDRSYDQGLFPEKYQAIKDMGVTLVPQDGALIEDGTIDCVIASSAVEPKIPDIASALSHDVPIKKRAELLAELLNGKRNSVAIAGTSGKSTVTAIAGFLARACDLDPTIINGAVMPDFDSAKDSACSAFGNARCAGSDVFIAEACESDGSVVLYHPQISLVHNITLDHKPIAELRPLFQELINHTKGAVIVNCDDAEVMALDYTQAKMVGYSLDEHPEARFQAKNIALTGKGARFDLIIGGEVGGEAYEVHSPMLGRHNVQNLLAAFAIMEGLGADVFDCIKAISGFSGVKSRLELIGSVGGITIIDDYAHNPDKIDAALSCVTQHAGRVLAYYQPHGFTPTKLMKQGYIEAFIKNLRAQDKLFLQDIYYAGGTVDRDISSQDLADGIKASALGSVSVFADRAALIDAMLAEADAGDHILIMGARDDSIRYIAPEFLARLTAKNSESAA